MQNWNAGKTQEYHERKEYNIETSVLRHDGPLSEESAAEAKEESASAAGEDRNILFAAPTCPNCRIAYSYLEKAGFPYEKIMAEDNAELALAFGVKQAPTLVIIRNGEFEKYAGAPAIKQYLSR